MSFNSRHSWKSYFLIESVTFEVKVVNGCIGYYAIKMQGPVLQTFLDDKQHVK